ncbi:MAG: hypothetical protein IT440_13145 [Phycisphaeraceae bacterium]|nr:hypothetical protein [Phycisphaeraceae bacterium]
MIVKGWVACVVWMVTTASAVLAQTNIPGASAATDDEMRLTLEPKWNVRDAVADCATRAGLAVKFVPDAALERSTPDVQLDHVECGAMVRLRQVKAQEALAWVLHVANLSATLSNETLTVTLSEARSQVPDVLTIRPEPVDIAAFLGPTAGGNSIGLRSREPWDIVQLFSFLCYRADLTSYVIAPDDSAQSTRGIMVGPIDGTPVVEVMTSVLAEAGYEALAHHQTLFLRPGRLATTTERQPDHNTGRLP